MSGKKIILNIVLVLIIPGLIYSLFELLLSFFGVNKIPDLTGSFLFEFLELVAVVYLFRFYKIEVLKALNTTRLSIKRILILIPLSILVRIPTIIFFIILGSFHFLPFLTQSLDKGVKSQWADLTTPTGYGLPIDILLTLIITVVLTPLVEELLFRGVIFNYFRRKMAPLYSILLTSVIFALAHIYPGLYFGSFLMGLALTWVYYKWRNIGYSILLHGLINLLPLLLGR